MGLQQIPRFKFQVHEKELSSSMQILAVNWDYRGTVGLELDNKKQYQNAQEKMDGRG